MPVARTLAVAVAGVTGQLIEVQADLSAGLPGLTFTGLADATVVEARDRIRAAVANSGLEWPNRRVTVALLPADVRKVGSRFDLAVACCVLAAAGAIPAEPLQDAVWVAEVGLDGALRPVRGVLPAVAAAVRAGARRVVVAPANAQEAALVSGASIRTADTLAQLVAWLRGERALSAVEPEPLADLPGAGAPDLTDVAGQPMARHALEVAAAGAHHLSMLGPPGAGKTMLAERLPGLLPPLPDQTALEVTAVHSVAGRLPEIARLVRRAPWQAPHHTASVAALVGGGSGIAGPGAISLAHGGVLFLDEAPEFAPAALEALRQPLEGGEVILHRQGGAIRYPARFLLVLAANPCPCGLQHQDCTCPAGVRRRYQHRLSGPLLDRIDIRLSVDPIVGAALLDDSTERESSAVVAARVAAARAAATERWKGLGFDANGVVPGSVLRRRPWRLPAAVTRLAQDQLEAGSISARGFDRILRLAWTMGDLAGREVPGSGDIAEAMYLRTGRDTAWAA